MALQNDDTPPTSASRRGTVSDRRSSNASTTVNSRPRTASNASAGRRRSVTAASGRLRSGSLRFLESGPGSGFWHATGESASRAPTMGEIRSGCYTRDGWHEEGQLERRGSTAQQIVGLQQRRLSRINSGLTRTTTSGSGFSPVSPAVREAPEEEDGQFLNARGERIGGQRAGEQVPVLPKVSEGDIREVAPVEEEKMKAEVNETTSPSLSSLSPSTEQPTIPQNEKNQGGIATKNASHEPDETGTYPNGYRFPPKHTWQESFKIGAKAFWKFTCTPLGFLIVIYGLNVVAWGAMIFFLLLNAAPAMCNPSCNDDDSARKKWIEVDAQVLNALFCVTGFGLIPWRFRDLYFLMQYRLGGNIDGLRRLAGINRGWFRLPGSDKLDEEFGPPPDPKAKAKPAPEGDYPPPPPYSDQEIDDMHTNPAIPLPVWKAPPAPLTGNRAPPTKIWKLDLVIWLYISNTLFQGALCGFMWGWSRIPRPAWGVGLFITLGCLVGIFAGVVVFKEGKRVKTIEGIPVTDADRVTMDEEARAVDSTNHVEDSSQN